MPSSSSTSSSRSSSPTLTASSSDGLYIPVHKRFSGSSISSSRSSRTFASGSSRTLSSSASSTSSESDSGISPPATPTFIYSRDTLLNLANSPLSRMSQPQRDILRSKVPEVMTNRKQRKTIEHNNHINAVHAALQVPARQSPPSHSNNQRQRHRKERTLKPVVV